MIQENLERSRNPLDKRQLDKTQYLELTSYNMIIFFYINGGKKDVENVVLGGMIPVGTELK
jgi:hypothetical protein